MSKSVKYQVTLHYWYVGKVAGQSTTNHVTTKSVLVHFSVVDVFILTFLVL